MESIFRWEKTSDIYLPHVLNSRELDTDYVSNLEESIKTEGFMPIYPVICFRRLQMPSTVFDEKTDALLICAAGFHRMTAAINLQLEKVYVEIKEGTFEEYLEVLHTDNFKFDPDQNPELGQVWKKAQKRTACKQLLCLPKFFKLADIVLSQLWHVSASNIKRWRMEVLSSFDDGSLHLLAPFPVSSETIDAIKQIADSGEREMADGTTVTIRPKAQVSTFEYYWALQKKVQDRDDLDWELHIEPYCLETYEKKAVTLSLKRLSEIEQKLEDNDPTFMETCKRLGAYQVKLNAAKEAYKKAFVEAKGAFELYCKGQGLLPDGYVSASEAETKRIYTSFGRVISKVFGKNLLAGYMTTDKVENYENATTQLEKLRNDINSSADYVQSFANRQAKAKIKKRNTLGNAMIAAHAKMLTAVQEKYPGINMDKFCFAVDSHGFRFEIGDTPATPIVSVEAISPDKSDYDLSRADEYYTEMLGKIEAGEDWIAELVESPDSELVATRGAAANAETEMWKAFESSEYSMYFYRDDLMTAAAKAIGCPREIPFVGQMESPETWVQHFQAIHTAILEKSDWIEALFKERKAFNLAHTNATCRLSSMWNTFEGLTFNISRETFAVAAAKQFKWYVEGEYTSFENYMLEKDYASLENLTVSELKKMTKRFDKIRDALFKKPDWIEALEAEVEADEIACDVSKLTLAEVLGSSDERHYVAMIQISWCEAGQIRNAYIENNTRSPNGVELSEISESLIAQLLQSVKDKL